MKDKLEEIYQHTIPHSTFLSKRAIDSCMYQSYILGKEENIENYNKLKKVFLDVLERLNDEKKATELKKEGGLL